MGRTALPSWGCNMEKWFKIPARFGQTLRWEGEGESRSFRGFLQPLRSKSKESWEKNIGELGAYALGKFAFYGPGDLPAERGDRIVLKEKRYVLQRVERFYFGDRALYSWGLCTEEGEALWTQSSQS